MVALSGHWKAVVTVRMSVFPTVALKEQKMVALLVVLMETRKVALLDTLKVELLVVLMESKRVALMVVL
jgi:hypothetical protein